MVSHFLSYIVTNILVLNLLFFLEFFVFVPRSISFSVRRQKRYGTSSHVACVNDVIVNGCEVKSAEKRYACLKM